MKNLTKLQKFNISYNWLTSLPSWLMELVNLESIQTRNNLIKNIPEALYNRFKNGLEMDEGIDIIEDVVIYLPNAKLKKVHYDETALEDVYKRQPLFSFRRSIPTGYTRPLDLSLIHI